MKTNNLFNPKTVSLALLMTVAVVVSCKKSANNGSVPEQSTTSELTGEEKTAIAQAGFSTHNVLKTEGGYLVEGDIFLTSQQLQVQKEFVAGLSDQGPKTEQYRSTNIVTGLSRELKIKVDAGTSQTVFNTATTEAVKRYNDLGLKLTFKLLSSTSTDKADIVINGADLGKTADGGTILGRSAGFPSGGNPATPIKLSSVVYNKNYTKTNVLASVIAHEIGHTIGLRHTDYADRNYSCGYDSNPNEGQSTVGAVYIPGTPKGGEPGSYMLACSDGTDRKFTANDIVALKALYPVK